MQAETDEVERRCDRMRATVAVTNLPALKEKRDFRSVWHPELIAERPNQVWSWDITKLMGPTKWSYFYLYVILDIFSRRVVGWCVADAESAVLFRPLFDDAIAKHNVSPGQLTLHADRGAR